jgi:hypothetical protein
MSSPTLPLVMKAPPSSVLPSITPGLLIILLTIVGQFPLWFIPVFLLAIGLAFYMRARQQLIVDTTGITVTGTPSRQVPWHEIERFAPGSGLLGGLVVHTTRGNVRSIAPCSWWGGAPADSEILLLEQIRREQTVD